MTHPRDGSVIAGLAQRQHGVVERGQLVELGFTRSAITRLSQAGWLHRVHPVVYAVGHRRLTVEGTYMAAVLACGPAGVLSHRAAAALWGLRPSSASIEVTVGTTARRVPGLRVHRSRRLQADDITHQDRIPVTTVPRTLLDLAAVIPPDHLHKALDRAERLRLFDLGEIEAVLARARGRLGAGALRRALGAWRPDHMRSELERRFALVVRRRGLPPPQTNVLVDGETATHEVDAFWAEHGLAVQLDGWEFHHTRRDREHDAESDTDLELTGLRVMRLTWDDVTTREARTVRRLAPLLANCRR